MRSALVIGNSGGIGKAIFNHLRDAGYAVKGLSRSVDGLDLRDESSIIQHLSALKNSSSNQDPPSFDRIIIATGALNSPGQTPEKSLRSLSSDAMIEQFKVNTIGPALLLKNIISLQMVPKLTPSHIAVLSARVGSIGDNRLGGWYSYRASKAAVNQVVHTAAIELARTHSQACLCLLHPGTVATEFTKKYQSRHSTITPEQCAESLMKILDNLDSENSGQFYDWKGNQVPW